MKLDRNENPKGHGKYALCNMRKLIPLLDKVSADPEQCAGDAYHAVSAFNELIKQGIITLGNETPGDQFFVMKYKDRFTAAGLKGYADAVWAHYLQLTPQKSDAGQAQHLELKSIRQYAEEMFEQAREAEKLGNRIPD